MAGLDPYPVGWYCVATSREIPKGAVFGRTFAGRPVAAFRGADGAVAVLDAICPHLGANLARGGTVVEGALRCPFHGFRFAPDGTCVGTGYGHKAPPSARIRAWPVREQNGLVLAWVGPGDPTFDVPPVDDGDWTPLRHRLMRLRSHPQETTENSVDLGHLGAVHGYTEVGLVGTPVVAGAYLGLRYHMTRANPFLGGLGRLTSDFDVHVHGLGHSLVDIRPRRAAGLHMRLFVLPSPVDGTHIDLRIAVSVQRTFPGPFGVVERIVRSIGLRAVAHDVQQDFDIWQNKEWIARPAVARGDGPIPLYRQWCRQFYTDAAGQQDVALA
jgi:nitrite reductase/ring-hydroxylating ferredoxin subunit